MLVKQYLGGSILGFTLIAAIWTIIYLIYPFEITRSANSKANLTTDIVSFSLGNTIEELLFRGFFLMTCVRLFGKIGGILSVSLLFGLFHLTGFGLTREGLSMVMTTFSMSLLFIAVIYHTKSIWTAVTLHITGNLLLHTLGFDGSAYGMFQIRFSSSHVTGRFITLIYEIVVITFAMIIFMKARKKL